MMVRSRFRDRRVAVTAVCAGLAFACGGGQAPATIAIRLVDQFESARVTGTSTTEMSYPRTEWRFDGADPGVTGPRAATRGWEAGPGVAGLTIRDGRLSGRTTAERPLLRITRPEEADDPDVLHAIEVRMRASAGANLSVVLRGGGPTPLDEVARQLQGDPFPNRTPIIAGDEMQTYTITPTATILGTGTRNVIVVPTDTAGATFDIESVRLVFRKEHLAEVPSGVGWQGLKEIYREVLVARSPEALAFDLDLPDNPWLDLAIGTVEDGPVRFKVVVGPRGRGDATTLVERTVTTPHRWETCTIDLTAFAGDGVTLTLSLEAADPGRLGFWGAPVVRARGAGPMVADGVVPARGTPPQGVIVIQADTLRADHLGVYGYERDTTPTLTRMAAEGALFRQLHAQATWTKVSTPSMMTSLYPSSHGVFEFPDRLPASANTLAESYRAAGYATAAYSSVLFTGKFTNLHQGFEELHESGSAADGDSSKTAREFTDRLVDWLERHRDGPFFAYLHVFDPHDPYEPYRPYDSLWADPLKKEEHVRHLDEVRKVIDDPLMRRFGMPSRAELEKAGLDADAFVGHDKDWYDGSIRGMDAEIDRLLERLRGLGLDDGTLIVFTSDHGEEFLEHGRMFHGQTVYSELTHIPLIMRWPGGVPGGTVVEEHVQSIDLMPTLLALSGLAQPEGLQGQSLVPLLAPAANGGSGGWSRRPAISEKALTTDAGASPPPRDTESYAIVEGNWKLIRNTRRPPGAPEFELYDITTDPLNRTNVADANPGVVGRLTKALDSWKQMALAARLKPDSEATKGLSQSELERLRSLGYIR